MTGQQEHDAAAFAQLADQAWARRAEERDHAPRKPPITPDALEEGEADCE